MFYIPRGKESTEVRISQNKGKESENSNNDFPLIIGWELTVEIYNVIFL